MRATQRRTLMTIALVVASAACDGEPLGPTQEATAPQFAQEAAEHHDISGYLLVTDVLDPGEQRVTNGGITQLRATVFEVTLYGDVSGVVVYTETANWTADGNGVLSGSFDGEGTWNGLTGGLYGRAAVPLREYQFRGTYVMHGDGDLAGYKFRVDLGGPLGCNTPCPYTGTVVTPASSN